jgi:imidazolonepropionase-like amidohydrolase
MGKGLILLLGLAAAEPAAGNETIAIRGATVIDTVGTRDVDNATVVVRDGRIVSVARGGKAPKGARVIEARGQYLIPGLIDGHVHFFQSGGLYTRPDALDLRSEVPYTAEVEGIQRRIGDTFARYVAAGVTGAVDMGGPFWNFNLRAVAAMRPDAPRLWIAGPLLSPVQPAELVTEDPPILEIATVEDARRQAQAQIARRTDFLKFWYIVGKDGPAEARARLDAMIAEADRAGVQAAVHATELETARAAVAAGADVLVHGVDDSDVDEAFVAAVKAKRVVYIPTLIVHGRYGAVYGGRNPLTPFERAQGQPEVARTFEAIDPAKLPTWGAQASAHLGGLLPRLQRNLMRMHKAGVPIVMGTDAGNVGTLHAVSVPAEMAAMAEAGMPPRAVLASATIAAARMLKAERDLGSVEKGKIADLVLLREDPRKDVRAVTSVALVLRAGRVIEPVAAAESPEALVQRQLEAYNAWNLDAFAGTYADDLTIWDLGPKDSGPMMTGMAKLREEYAGLFEKVKPKVEVLKRVTMGPWVIDHERGDFGGQILEAAAVYLVDQGRIRRVWFADGSVKGDTPAAAAALVDRLRQPGADAKALHAENHRTLRLALDPADARPVVLPAPSGPPSTRIQTGAFVIDHEAQGAGRIVIRLVQDGRISRTWIAERP